MQLSATFSALALALAAGAGSAAAAPGPILDASGSPTAAGRAIFHLARTYPADLLAPRDSNSSSSSNATASAWPSAAAPAASGNATWDGPLLSDDPYPWNEAFAKAKALVDQMTIAEKANITLGYTGNCVGFTGTVPRLNLTALCLQDGPLGVRPVRRVSQFPAGVTTAATWDRTLMAKRAEALASEFRDKGVNMWLGPVTGGPLGRSPFGGRNWEGFGSDEYLNGVASYLTVRHAQKIGIMTCVKHFLAYEQETFRDPFFLIPQPGSTWPPNGQDPIDSELDGKTIRQLYLWPFAEAVRAGTSSVMCSYNRINGVHACEDDVSQNKILKGELNFKGNVVSDWGGTWSSAGSALGGLDTTMPGSAYMGAFGTFFEDLAQLVQNGTVPEVRLDDMVLRTLTAWFHLQDPETWPQPSFNVLDLAAPTNNVRGDHYKIIQEIGEDSMVLLKNNATNGLGLPLRGDLQSVLVAGQDAGPNPQGWTSCGQTGQCEINANNGTLTVDGGSGWAIPPYISDPLSAIQLRARNHGYDVNIALENWNLTNAVAQATVSQAALVFVNAFATEGMDRQNLTAWGNGDELIKAVAANNNNTIVVMHTGGPLLMEEWADHPNVTAIVHAMLPGQESGNAITPVLFGDKSPSGKLPFVMGKKLEDWPPHTITTDNVKSPQANFTEKLLIDYKWFQAHNITPRYAFGHGLTYSKFELSDFSLSHAFKADEDSLNPTREPYDGWELGQSFYDQIAEATATVKNTGHMRAAEVVQLYATFAASEGEPPYVLRGFEKVWLDPGKSATVTMPIRRKDVYLYDEARGLWRKPNGKVKFSVGFSSDNLKYSHSISI